MIFPKDVHLFNGDEILDFIINCNPCSNIKSNWFYNNVDKMENVRISNITGVVTDDGYGHFKCELSADFTCKDTT